MTPQSQQEAQRDIPGKRGAPSSPNDNRRLRLALITNSVAIGGMEKHAEMIARDLDRSQVKVFTICPDWEPIAAWAEAFDRVGDQHARITPDRRYGYLHELRETYRLWKQLRAWRIQVAHLHLTTFAGGNLALVAMRLAGVRRVYCTEHLPPEKRVPFFMRLGRGFFSANLDGVVCVSETNREARQRFLFTPPRKTVVVNNGIDVAPFTPTPADELTTLRERLGLPEGAPVVGTVVRLVDEKGLNYLFDAMPRILEAVPEARLLIVGDGPLRADLEAQATHLGYHDRVIFAGFQSDPRPYLSLMNAFVLPVPFGSASIGLLEAMAMRRAVIITFGGKGEAVEHEVTGLRLPPRDPAALAEGIIRVLQYPAYERTLGENARRRVEDAFSSEGVARQLLTLYQQGLTQPAPIALGGAASPRA